MPDFPTHVIYGVYADDLLTFLPADYAHGAANEIARWRQVSTWGEALTLAAETTWVTPPFEADDFRDEYTDDDLFTLDEFEPWPPTAATVALDLIDDDWPIGETQDLFMAPPLLKMSAADENALLDCLRQRGATWTRDDALIAKASGW